MREDKSFDLCVYNNKKSQEGDKSGLIRLLGNVLTFAIWSEQGWGVNAQKRFYDQRQKKSQERRHNGDNCCALRDSNFWPETNKFSAKFLSKSAFVLIRLPFLLSSALKSLLPPVTVSRRQMDALPWRTSSTFMNSLTVWLTTSVKNYKTERFERYKLELKELE